MAQCVRSAMKARITPTPFQASIEIPHRSISAIFYLEDRRREGSNSLGNYIASGQVDHAPRRMCHQYYGTTKGVAGSSPVHVTPRTVADIDSPEFFAGVHASAVNACPNLVSYPP